MPRLPTSSNVQPISPRIASDPGIQAPVGAFESPVGIAAGELSPGFEKLAEVSRRQENRRDTIDRVSLINQHNEEINQELMRLNTEADLSREDVLSEFGSFMTKRRKMLLESHKGSNDSITVLDARLQDISASYTGKASALSAEIARDKVKKSFSGSLNSLVASAAQNPSRQNIDSLFLDLETNIDDLKGALDPIEESSHRDAARELITLGAMDNLLARGRIEQAAAMIEVGGVGQFLSPEKLNTVQKTIETARFEQDKIRRKMTEAEAVMGRPLSQDERAQVLGFKPEKLSEREERSKQLKARGFSPELSDDIAAKDVKIVGPDNFGNFLSVNVATNESRPVGEKDQNAIKKALGIEDSLPERESPPVVKTQKGGVGAETRRPPMEESIKKGTGPFAKIQAGISNVFGPLDASQAFFEDTTTARERIRTFNQLVKSAIVNNERFPEGEQKRLETLLPNVDTFFKDPDTAVADFKELKTVLEESKAAKQKEFKKKEITAKRRGELADMISTIDEVMSQMTYKPGKSETQDFTQEDLEFTAEKHGITIDEVKRRLGVR